MCEVPEMPKGQWPRLDSESLLPIFKAFSHLRCPYLTTTYTEFLLKHERVPKQFLGYDRFLSIVWIRHHFCGVIIDIGGKYIITFDGLNLSENKNNSINDTYIKFARIFRIFKIYNVVLKRPQNPKYNLCLPLVATFFLHYFKCRFTLDMTFHLIKTNTPVLCIREAKKKAKTINKKNTFEIPPPTPYPLPLQKFQTLVNYCQIRTPRKKEKSICK